MFEFIERMAIVWTSGLVVMINWQIFLSIHHVIRPAVLTGLLSIATREFAAMCFPVLESLMEELSSEGLLSMGSGDYVAGVVINTGHYYFWWVT